MRIAALLTSGFLATFAIGAPLLPTIDSHDFNFGAYNQDGTFEYLTNGGAPDTLTYTWYSLDHEVTAYWPDWPDLPVYPVWDLGGMPNFGGDLVLNVQFTGQDAPYVGPGGTIDVSLIGTGANEAPGAADLEIYGTIELGANTLSGLLWSLDLEDVSLYGYSDRDTYALEGVGTVVGGLVAEENSLIGTAGAMRGHLDFIDAIPGWMPPEYDPTDPNPMLDAVRAAYSGETGVIPEPASLGLLVAGLSVLLRRR